MNELTTKRLAIIRHLFDKGKALSLEGEPMNGLCLLPFHDSVEMFMKLCADERNVPVPRNASFMEYFTKLPMLQDKAQMDSLNSRRVSLKHHGQMPSSLDVEITRVNVIDFFEHNTPVFFGCKLEDVSLEVLIVYPEVRGYIAKYHEFIDSGEYGDAQAQCQIAFKVFMKEYYRKCDKVFDLTAESILELGGLQNPHLEDKTDRYLESLREAVYRLGEAISVMNLGINFFRYSEFVALGPVVYRWQNPEGDYRYYIDSNKLYDANTAKVCYDFVIETILQLQGKNVFLY